MLFTDITIEDRDVMGKYLLCDGAVMSDRCFASLFIWGEHYKLKKCIKDGFLYILSENEGSRLYHMPAGFGNMTDALAEIEKDAGERDYSVILITEKEKDKIAATGRYEITEDRANFDYIYNAEDLISLPGKKYHSKRNFINRFLKEYEGRWSYKDVSPESDGDEILHFLRE